METDIAYFVTYPCPGCRAELEGPHGGWNGWRRCPKCGTPALPPEVFLGHPATRRRMLDAPGEDILIIEDERVAAPRRRAPGLAPSPDAASLIPPPTSPVVTTLRLVFITGLVISLFLLLIAYLDDNSRITGIAGSMSIVFFLLLVRLASRRRLRNPRARSGNGSPQIDQ